MTTLADLTLMVARICSEVTEGEATAASDTTLTDTENLVQPNEYWDRGILWFLSGDLAGKVTQVLDYASNILTFPSQAPAPAVGQVYAVARSTYPYRQLVSAINQALHETYVIRSATPLTGDGNTIEFGLDNIDVVNVDLVDGSTNPVQYHRSTHWREIEGVLRFDWGYAPRDGWNIIVEYKTQHPNLVAATDTVDPQINAEWLRWKSAEYALYWAVRAYGDAKEYRIEELLNRVLESLRGKWPRKPIVRVHTAGG